MAILLVYGRNNTHSEPIKDQRGSWKRGDVVQVFDDDHHDGDLITNPIAPPFYLVKVTGITKTQAEKYLQSDRDGDNVTRRRTFSILVDDIPVNFRNALRDNRYVEVTWTQLKNFVQNKTTLQVEE